ncbi:hypothetical protein [Hyphobacterium sp.]|uniref:hypothetical protein n=1 Tax=Hyphobacterium sp. TaxID=2004662 RepID=UPI003BA9DA49
MVEKLAKRRRDRVDWEAYARQYEAGMTAAEIARHAGYTERWIRNRMHLCRQDSPAVRARHHAEAVRRELVRAEHVLLEGNIDAAIKQMRALDMLMRLEKDLTRTIAPDTDTAETEEIDSAHAELERRFASLRRAHGLPPVSRQGEGDEIDPR